jgi:hypothetical protein
MTDVGWQEIGTRAPPLGARDRRIPRLARAAGVLGAALAAAPATARAEGAVALATCGTSTVELLPIAAGAAPEVRASLATPRGVWQFTATVGQARAGQRTRTFALEEPRAAPGARSPYAAQPTQVTLDLFVETGKLIARHASEGAPDPAIAIDLDRCTFATGAAAGAVDALVTRLAEATDPLGCDAAHVRKAYVPQLAAARVPPADAEREARALCEATQPALAARARLEQRLSDRAADQRAQARGPALLRVEQSRLDAWKTVDACLAGGAPSEPVTAAKLRAAADHARRCYDRVASPAASARRKR